MSCGFEHLSNCHGELTMITMGAATGAFWIRRSWDRIVAFIKAEPKDCCHHDEEKDPDD